MRMSRPVLLYALTDDAKVLPVARGIAGSKMEALSGATRPFGRSYMLLDPPPARLGVITDKVR
jgi:hypothetical protein